MARLYIVGYWMMLLPNSKESCPPGFGCVVVRHCQDSPKTEMFMSPCPCCHLDLTGMVESLVKIEYQYHQRAVQQWIDPKQMNH